MKTEGERSHRRLEKLLHCLFVFYSYSFNISTRVSASSVKTFFVFFLYLNTGNKRQLHGGRGGEGRGDGGMRGWEERSDRKNKLYKRVWLYLPSHTSPLPLTRPPDVFGKSSSPCSGEAPPWKEKILHTQFLHFFFFSWGLTSQRLQKLSSVGAPQAGATGELGAGQYLVNRGQKQQKINRKRR